MDRRRPRIGAFTGYPFTGYELSGYPFTGVQIGEDTGSAMFAMIWNGSPTHYTSYTRLDVAYAADPSGNQVEVPRDVPPYEYVDGEKRFLQYEGTNICLHSQEYDNPVYIKTNTSTIPDQGVAPDGTLTADEIEHTSASADMVQPVTITANKVYTYSAYIKYVDNQWSFIQFGATSGFRCFLDILNGVAGTCGAFGGATLIDSGIIDKGNGWYRVYITGTLATGETSSGAVGPRNQVADNDFTEATGVSSLIWGSNVTQTNYLLPYIPAAGTAATVNKGTSSMLAEDIADRCYNFTNAGNETVNTGLLKQVLTSVSFYIRLRSTNGDAITQCPLDSSDAMVAVTSGAGYAINFSHNGTDYVTDTELAFNTTYLIVLTDAGVLSVNGTPDTLSAGASYAFASTDILFGSRGADLHIDGYMWDVKYYDTTLLAWYKCAEYRQDVFVLDSSGNGNHGTIVDATLSEFISENNGFGYPVNEQVRTPWHYTTDDGVVVPFGLRELFGGKADGALLITGSLVAINRYKIITTETDHFGVGVVVGDIVTGLTTALDANNTVRQVSPAVGTIPFTSYIPHGFPEDVVVNGGMDTDTDWVKGTGWTISGGTANCDGTQTANSLLYQSVFNTPDDDNEYFVLSGDFVTTAGELRYFNGLSADNILDGSCKLLFQKKEDYAFATFVANTDFIGSVDNIDIRKAIVLLKNSDGTPYLYIDPFDHLIKATDGTNTAISASAAVAGTEVSGWLAFNGDEMWITLEGTKGAVQTFEGYFPDIGNRLFGVTNGTYQTIRHLYFEDELFFEYVYHNGELVTHNGEPVIVYL